MKHLLFVGLFSIGLSAQIIVQPGGGGGGGAPTGTAGGGLGGSYPNPTVVNVQNSTLGTGYLSTTPAGVFQANPNSVPLGLDPNLPILLVVGGDGNKANNSWFVAADGHSRVTYFGNFIKQFSNGFLDAYTSEHTISWTATTSSDPSTNTNWDTAISRNAAGIVAFGINSTPGSTGGGWKATTAITVLGGKYQCTHGANGTCGMVTLASGTATISTTAIGALAAAGAAGYTVALVAESCSSCGSLSIGTVVAGTSFVINSTNASDASNVYWEIRYIN